MDDVVTIWGGVDIRDMSRDDLEKAFVELAALRRLERKSEQRRTAHLIQGPKAALAFAGFAAPEGVDG